MIIKGEDSFNKVIGSTVDGIPTHLYDIEGNLVTKLSIMDSLIDEYIAERDKKYYLHVLPGIDGYLNVETVKGEPEECFTDTRDESENVRTKFTQQEIDVFCRKFHHIDLWSVAEKVGNE